MQNSIVTVILTVFVGCFGALSFYFWRRSTSLYTLLIEGASRYEDMRRRASALENSIRENEGKVREFNQKSVVAEKAAYEANKRVQDLVQELDHKKTEIAYVTDKLERQKAYLENVVAKQSDELQNLKTEHEQLRHQAAEAQSDWGQRLSTFKKQSQQALDEAHADRHRLEEKLKAMEAERKDLAQKAADGDPVEIKKLKRKISQYARLYITMKGLKEMAEERSQNWEVGLQKFATWIIQQKMGPKANLPTAIGPRVGLALKMIGQELVDDDEPASPHEAEKHAHGVAVNRTQDPSIDGLSIHSPPASPSAPGSEARRGSPVTNGDTKENAASAAAVVPGRDSRRPSEERPESAAPRLEGGASRASLT